MTGSIFACLDRASMHSSLDMLKRMHISIKWCTYTVTIIDPHHKFNEIIEKKNKENKKITMWMYEAEGSSSMEAVWMERK